MLVASGDLIDHMDQAEELLDTLRSISCHSSPLLTLFYSVFSHTAYSPRTLLALRILESYLTVCWITLIASRDRRQSHLAAPVKAQLQMTRRRHAHHRQAQLTKLWSLVGRLRAQLPFVALSSALSLVCGALLSSRIHYQTKVLQRLHTVLKSGSGALDARRSMHLILAALLCSMHSLLAMLDTLDWLLHLWCLTVLASYYVMLPAYSLVLANVPTMLPRR